MNSQTILERMSRWFSWIRSLRTRLVLGNLLITFLAIAGMGYYVTYRSQQSTTFLIGKLDQSVYEQAQEELFSASIQQSIYIENFFITIQRDISKLSGALGSMLSQQSPSIHYWDAAQSLDRLASGSWDNSDEEPSSVFMPADAELTEALIIKLNSARQIDYIVPSILLDNPDVVALYFGGTLKETIYFPNIDLANIVPSDFDVTSRPWYINAAPANNPDKLPVWSDPYLDAALHGLIITSSAPVYDHTGNFLGVTAMDIQLTRITSIIDEIKLGQSGYAFIVDQEMRLIAMPEHGYESLGIDPESIPLGDALSPENITAELSPYFWSILTKMTSGESGLEIINIDDAECFFVYQQIPEIQYSLAIIVPTQELLAESIAANEQLALTTRSTNITSLIMIVAIILVALFATIGIGNRLTRPLDTITMVAEEITGGNINAQAKTSAYVEINTLATAFNSMTEQLRDTIGSLETRVAERTQALERRAIQTQAAVDVGRAAASERDLDKLLKQTTQLINQRFGFYHVGIFLLDDIGEYAVLRATNSVGGQKMLSLEHKLKVGHTGIVGYVTSKGEARIALDVGEDAAYFDNPHLPTTRSEMALPLKVADRILGALDVQSEQENAFGEEDISTLQILADQLAIAIDNARLVEESMMAAEASRRAYGMASQAGWQKLIAEEGEIGYFIKEKTNAKPITRKAEAEFYQAIETMQPVVTGDRKIVYIPILVRGFSVGCLRLGNPVDKDTWQEKDIQAASSIVEQLGTALESARLYRDISKRAERERLVSEITSKIRNTNDPKDMLITAVEELKRTLGVQNIQIKQTPTAPKPDNENL